MDPTWVRCRGAGIDIVKVNIRCGSWCRCVRSKPKAKHDTRLEAGCGQAYGH